MQGFFSSSDLQVSKAPVPLVAQCGACGLWKSCQSPKIPPSGKGRRKVLIVGEGAGKNEDIQGLQFVGDSGQLLQQTLAKFDVDLREDCFITNSIICRAHTPDDHNRTPTDKEIEYCRPNAIKAINDLQPEVIILLGLVAVKSVIGWLWKEDVGLASRWDGWQIPCNRLNAWLCPTWHPAYILRSDYGSGKENDIRKMFFEQHLKAAFDLEGRPWKKVPDWDSKIQVLMDPDEAANIIAKHVWGGLAAFDFETTTLKPDGPHAEIVCCSISDGKLTIAYPWHGRAIQATKQFIQSAVGKVSSNLKMEERWCQKVFGHGVTNWAWDTMVAAHVLDNRAAISSIKFQAFVKLGTEAWDEQIKPYLKAKSANTSNRIREVSLPKLMQYCGMDSLMEVKVAHLQMKEMNDACHYRQNLSTMQRQIVA